MSSSLHLTASCFQTCFASSNATTKLFFGRGLSPPPQSDGDPCQHSPSQKRIMKSRNAPFSGTVLWMTGEILPQKLPGLFFLLAVFVNSSLLASKLHFNPNSSTFQTRRFLSDLLLYLPSVCSQKACVLLIRRILEVSLLKMILP